ncbi:lactate dehydrogenase/glycoside hydrolase [Aspergillus ambiguus]|uniref:lactate/malate dehydrogenase family protein n=1 Tax=Aspergillus ambiguus TaxID=176160 RepID=UPI003CCD9536
MRIAKYPRGNCFLMKCNGKSSRHTQSRMESQQTPKPTVAVIGVGQVGGAVAYALILSSVASEILLVDIKSDLRDAQVRDLSDVAYAGNSGTRVRAGTYHEARECDIVVITAGSKYSIGETSSQHMDRNIAIVRGVVNAMRPYRPDTILLVVANPVDLLTSLAHEISGLPASQVLGSGTFLDSVRLRGLVSEAIGVSANSIDLYVLGVHGPSQVAAWSTATVGGIPIGKAVLPVSFDRAKLADECRHRSQRIVSAKGATPFGIGSIVTSICSSIVCDKRNVRPISCYQPEYGCCFSLPVVLGRKGVIRRFAVPVSDEEKDAIKESAGALKETLDKIHDSEK